MIGGPILGGVAPVIYKTASTVFVFDGNSLVEGYGSSAGQTMEVQLAALAPISGGLVVANTGVGGQTTAAMDARASTAVDPLFDPNKNAVLGAWEGTNSICNSPAVTGLQAAADMAAYIANRKIATPKLRVVLLTTIPRYFMQGTTVLNGNAELLAYNAYLLANYKAMGADAIVDVRQDPVFVYPAGASTMPSYMTPFSSDGHTHLNNAGLGKIAAMVAPVLRRLPRAK